MIFDLVSLCRDLLGHSVIVRMHVHGSSMYPTIRSGDLVEIHPSPAPHPRRGDIILFESSRGLTLHRVRQIRPDGAIVARGDAARQNDAPIGLEMVVGVARTRVRNGRRSILKRFYSPLLGELRRFGSRVLSFPLRRPPTTSFERAS